MVDEKDKCVPAVFHLEWPEDTQDLVCWYAPRTTPMGQLQVQIWKQRAFYFAGSWRRQQHHVSNTNLSGYTVTIHRQCPSQVTRMATKSLKMVGLLLMALDLLRERQTSPLVENKGGGLCPWVPPVRIPRVQLTDKMAICWSHICLSVYRQPRLTTPSGRQPHHTL